MPTLDKRHPPGYEIVNGAAVATNEILTFNVAVHVIKRIAITRAAIEHITGNRRSPTLTLLHSNEELCTAMQAPTLEIRKLIDNASRLELKLEIMRSSLFHHENPKGNYFC